MPRNHKKEWARPKLMILMRSQQTEMVLVGCKAWQTRPPGPGEIYGCWKKVGRCKPNQPSPPCPGGGYAVCYTFAETGGPAMYCCRCQAYAES